MKKIVIKDYKKEKIKYESDGVTMKNGQYDFVVTVSSNTWKWITSPSISSNIITYLYPYDNSSTIATAGTLKFTINSNTWNNSSTILR